MYGTSAAAGGKDVYKRQVMLYEMARVYRPKGDVLPNERIILTLGAYGDMDFFRLKGCLEAIFREMNVLDIKFVPNSDVPYYHPGRCAGVYAGEKFLGMMGQVHPTVAENFGVGQCYTAEIDFYRLVNCIAPEKSYTPLPKFPTITRDIAVVCDNTVTIAQLTDCIKAGGGALLKGEMCIRDRH